MEAIRGGLKGPGGLLLIHATGGPGTAVQNDSANLLAIQTLSQRYAVP